MKKLLILLVVLNLVNCNSIRRKFHYYVDMAYSPAIDTSEVDFVGNRDGNMFPPAGTIPYKFFNTRFAKTIPGNYVIDDKYMAYSINGRTFYNVPQDHEDAAKLIHSPYVSDEKTLARGKERFRIYCSPCHGLAGHGDGPVKAKFPIIKAIARPTPDQPVRAEAWPVERIFMVITTGINNMNSYAPQIPEKDRWAIAHYVKQLQAESRK